MRIRIYQAKSTESRRYLQSCTAHDWTRHSSGNDGTTNIHTAFKWPGFFNWRTLRSLWQWPIQRTSWAAFLKTGVPWMRIPWYNVWWILWKIFHYCCFSVAVKIIWKLFSQCHCDGEAIAGYIYTFTLLALWNTLYKSPSITWQQLRSIHAIIR